MVARALRFGVGCLLMVAAVRSVAGLTVLTNQIGYDVGGAKRAVVMGREGEEVSTFRVLESGTGKDVLDGKVVNVGRVDHWKEWVFWTVDFSSLGAEGNYVISCATTEGELRSFPFLVERDLLKRRTLSDVAYYFKDMRVVGKQEEEDRYLRFEDSADPKKVVDLHGGWADATGDSGKHLSHLNFANYFNPQHGPLTTWALFYAGDELGARKTLGNVRRRMVDEAYYGADYLYRSKNPAGSFYRSVDDGKPRFVAKDGSGGIFGKMEIQNPLQKGDVGKISENFFYEVGFRCGGGMAIAGLAAAASHGGHGEFSREQYLRAAEEGYAFLSKNDSVYSHDGKNNIIDDYCVLMAATELFKATGKEAYKRDAEGRAKSLMGRWVENGPMGGYWRADDKERPFFHASDAGLPVVALLN
ncbi:MAG: cellulase N-terminal Ig-like domain-containing protein [Phycisphaerae bacterium]